MNNSFKYQTWDSYRHGRVVWVYVYNMYLLHSFSSSMSSVHCHKPTRYGKGVLYGMLESML